MIPIRPLRFCPLPQQPLALRLAQGSRHLQEVCMINFGICFVVVSLLLLLLFLPLCRTICLHTVQITLVFYYVEFFLDN